VGLPPAAVKVAELAPAATVTEPGTVNAELLLLRATAVAAETAPLSVTAQAEEPPAFTDVGLQVTEVNVMEGAAAVMVPPALATAAELPLNMAPIGEVTPMELLVRVGAVVTETTATVPFAIVLEFIPQARHVYTPAPALQLRDLPAVVDAAPAATEMFWMSEAE
jgi:hypothetical protein